MGFNLFSTLLLAFERKTTCVKNIYLKRIFFKKCIKKSYWEKEKWQVELTEKSLDKETEISLEDRENSDRKGRE